MTDSHSHSENTGKSPGNGDGKERGFVELLHTDIRDLEIARSLRKLGNTKVMEWDFKDVMPSVHKWAYQEVDVAGWVKRLAEYRVTEWDFRDLLAKESHAGEETPAPEEMRELADRTGNFLHFVMMNLIETPSRSRLRVEEIAPAVLRFRVIVTAEDQKTLVGRQGVTAAAIRGLVKGMAEERGAHALLQILTPEEETRLAMREKGDG